MRRSRLESVFALLIIVGLFGFLRVQLHHAHTQQLAIAVRNGDIKAARWLLEKGADVNGRDKDGDLILMAAVRFLNTDMVRLLEKHGAQSDDVTRFMIAAFLNRTDVVQTMLQNGLNPNVKDRDGDTALSCAAQQGHVEVVEILLKHGTNPQTVNQHGLTVVDWAMRCENPTRQKQMIVLLQKHGVKTNALSIPRLRRFPNSSGY